MRRPAAALPVTGAVVAVIGLALLAVEVVRTLGNAVLGTLGTTLLWVGVALVGIGLLLLVLAIAAASDETSDDAPVGTTGTEGPADGALARSDATTAGRVDGGGAEPARPVPPAPVDDWQVVPDDAPAAAAASPPVTPPPAASPPAASEPAAAEPPPGPAPLHTPLPEPPAAAAPEPTWQPGQPPVEPAGPADAAPPSAYGTGDGSPAEDSPGEDA